MVQAVRQYTPGLDHAAATKAVSDIASRKELLDPVTRAAGEIATMALPFGAASKAATAGNTALKAQIVKQMLAAAAATMATQPTKTMENFLEEKGKQGATAGGTVAALSAPGAAIGKTVGPAADFIKKVVGRNQEVLQARGTAAEIAKGALSAQVLREEAEATAKEMAAKTLAGARDRIDKQLQEPPKNSEGKAVPSLHDIGTEIHGAVNEVFTAAKQSRAAAADTQFSSVLQAAQKKEAAGARVDTKGIEADLQKLLAQGEGDAKLEASVKDMLTSVKGRPSEDLKAAGVPQGKTVAELELTRRKLNDIAYSGPLEGYGSTVKLAARDAVKKIDTAMGDFVPEFKQYKADYAKNSLPLEGANTRLGKLLTGTAGGLKGDAYAATAKQALPARLLGTRDGQELLTDMLAGGKKGAEGISPEARQQAERLVDKFTENWILEDTRGKTGKQAVDRLNSPALHSAVSPEASTKLLATFKGRSALEKASADLGERAEAAKVEAGKAQQRMAGIAQNIRDADYLTSRPAYHDQVEGLQGYMTAINKLHEEGNIPEGKWRAAHDYVSKARTLEEQTKRARKIAVTIGYAAGASGGALYGGRILISH
jgi:hypothetical protein